MINTLHEDPEYPNLVRLVRDGSCVAFVGSGLSTLKTLYPSWGQLITRICKACGLPIPSSVESQDADLLLKRADEARDRDEQAYCRVLGEVFGKPVVETRRAYDLLMKSKFQSYVTINFDPLLATESRKLEHKCDGVYSFPSLPIHRIDKRAVYYIHGCIQPGSVPRADQIVLGRRDFERAYSDEGGTLKSFLHQLLTYQPLLFLGCTLREPPLKPIFENCLQVREFIKREWPNHRVPPRYTLLPMRFYRKESYRSRQRDIDQEQEETDRFRQLDITVLRYDPLDEKHSAIEGILEEWCELAPIYRRSGFQEGEVP